MALKKSELYSSIWASCDKLRGKMDASQYKDYVLTLLFVKYVSDKYAGDPDAPIIIPAGSAFDMVALKGTKDIGDKINKKILAPLARENNLPTFPNFNDDEKLGSGKAIVDTLTDLIAIFENPALDFSKNRADGDDLLGDAYEYLMRHFATQSGKSKGQYYTPAEVSRVIAQLIGIHDAKTTKQTTVCDPTCGSGSLLLRVAVAISTALIVRKRTGNVAPATNVNAAIGSTFTSGVVKRRRHGSSGGDCPPPPPGFSFGMLSGRVPPRVRPPPLLLPTSGSSRRDIVFTGEYRMDTSHPSSTTTTGRQTGRRMHHRQCTTTLRCTIFCVMKTNGVTMSEDNDDSASWRARPRRERADIWSRLGEEDRRFASFMADIGGEDEVGCIIRASTVRGVHTVSRYHREVSGGSSRRRLQFEGTLAPHACTHRSASRAKKEHGATMSEPERESSRLPAVVSGATVKDPDSASYLPKLGIGLGMGVVLYALLSRRCFRPRSHAPER